MPVRPRVSLSAPPSPSVIAGGPRAFSHETPPVGRRPVRPECLAWISGQFIPTGVYAYKGEFYNVRWGGFQLGRVLAESAVREACSPFDGLTAKGRDSEQGLA